ncbi:MAG: transglutaminase family protein, partial [Verrucomicrobia bacterium]|nr:transglutaminase family protein [Verrucomicrobiota bacterium]
MEKGPVTELTEVLRASDQVLRVKSTEGFPPSGAVVAWCEVIGYERKTATTFEGLTRGLHGTLVNDGMGRGRAVTELRYHLLTDAEWKNVKAVDLGLRQDVKDTNSPLFRQRGRDVYVTAVRRPDRPWLLPLREAVQVIPGESHYETFGCHLTHNGRRFTTRPMRPGETLRLGSGSCRDSAWLLCQLLRHFGLASRFVSGYLIQLKPDVKSLDGPSGTDHDFTDLHAWTEVYLPGAGWIGLDPTSGLLAGEGHIPLACAPDPTGAAPITGLVDECECEFSHDMKVTRVHESPRVTKPYSEEQWKEIEKLGHQIDAELVRQDCRLTMGGEPTFVSIDDMDGAEWNTIAQGPTKRRLGDELMRRLKRRFTTGALLHYGQGKWYPGESLPRWAFATYWRRDGQPIWQDEALFALESRDYGFDALRAERFIHALGERLGCGTRWVMPAFEDAWYYLWKERRLPTNVDPFRSNLKNEEDRVRLAKIFEQGLDKVIGYVLPVQRQYGADVPPWLSGPWFLRGERCYLIPGDSPVGFRLPLDSLPHVAAADFPYLHEQDPLEGRGPLPPHPGFRAFPPSQSSGRAA